MFLFFGNSFSQDLTSTLLQGSPFKPISQNPNLYQVNNMKFMLKNLTEIIIKKILT